jgi:beta-galactosidase GanA
MTQEKPMQDTPIPQLRRQGNAIQLIVDGEPFLVLGGELRNSSASNSAYMTPIWERMLALNINTVLTPVSWELIEPEEGTFDFSLVDALIQDARTHNLRLILLWFGSWKNGTSSYIPGWVKQDYRRFPRIQIQDGKSTEVLSTLAEANWQADATAFAALMQHLREVDGTQHTVIMVQVENEVGVQFDSRDRSTAANTAFNESVPQELMQQLKEHQGELAPEVQQSWMAHGLKTTGNWEEIFGSGPDTDELFMAWNYARYIEKVVLAGKNRYALPMFVNAWLRQPEHKMGAWLHGGPLPYLFDMWFAGASHLDFLTPDIYAPNFSEWCQRYTRRGNPLFIPETRPDAIGAQNIFYAIGQHNAIGTSPFAVDSIEQPENAPLSQTYALLKQLAPLILEQQGRDATIGILLDKEHPGFTWQTEQYELKIALDNIWGNTTEFGYGLVIALSSDTFIGVGCGFGISFRPTTSGPTLAGLRTVDEGIYDAGKWLPGRRLNGDETDQGRKWRFSPLSIGIQRCTVYRYE